MDQLDTPAHKRILLTGSNGFLGQKLCDALVEHTPYVVHCTSKSKNRNPKTSGYQFTEIDLQDFASLGDLIHRFAPTHIVHTAAISSVENCANDPALCQVVNVDSVDFLADICEKNGIHLTFLSTDFVFDGQNGPYREDDHRQPTNAYGHSKYRAEAILQSSQTRYAILRTILVYGITADKNRSNLILWAKEKLANKEQINVVDDQYRMPTFVDDLANACLLTIEHDAQGIFHISSEMMYSIKEIVEQVAAFWQLDTKLIKAVSAADIGQATNRPAKTGFVIKKAKDLLGFEPTPLLQSFQLMDEQIKSLNTYYGK